MLLLSGDKEGDKLEEAGPRMQTAARGCHSCGGIINQNLQVASMALGGQTSNVSPDYLHCEETAMFRMPPGSPAWPAW